jgi:hypothetical protein
MGVLSNATTQEHRYATCRDEDCQRFACRVWREGFREGYGAGHAAGFAQGQAVGYSEGYAAGAASCGDG